MQINRLPRKTVRLWQIRLSILGAVPVILLCALSFLTLWLLFAAAMLAVVLAVFLFWYVPKYFGSYEILFPNGAIVINCGVFIKTSHIMPFSRLVYAQSFSSPLAKRMGLAALSLKAARSSVLVPELELSDVEYFIDFLTAEGG